MTHTGADATHPHPGPGEDLLFDDTDLRTVRDLVRCCAHLSGLRVERVDDLVLAVHEIAVCAFVGDRAPARLLITTTRERLVCEIAEPENGRAGAHNQLDSRLVDPGLGPGRGWRLARALCDGLRATADGRSLELSMLLPYEPGEERAAPVG